MLKRLDRWVNEFTDFACDHPVFIAITGAPIVLIAVIALCFALEAATVGTESESPIKWEGDVTLQDTRRVHCIRFHDGGVSCDWSRADGSDNL